MQIRKFICIYIHEHAQRCIYKHTHTSTLSLSHAHTHTNMYGYIYIYTVRFSLLADEKEITDSSHALYLLINLITGYH